MCLFVMAAESKVLLTPDGISVVSVHIGGASLSRPIQNYAQTPISCMLNLKY